MNSLLSIEDLRVSIRGLFPGTDRIYPVDGVSLTVASGETLGLVGESGCGKSMTSMAIMGLLPRPGGRVERGRIVFRGQDLAGEDMLKIRGRDISMIFQDPMTSLNPVYTVGEQIVEAIRAHEPGASRGETRARVVSMLGKVGIPSPEKRFDAYPHLLSGGMRQRVMIAMALILHPGLLIADEPTTALDVTIQAQILYLMADLRREMGMSVLLITHNMGLVAENADRVAVMYAGRIVEQAPTSELFRAPSHPYTRGLLDSIPRMTDQGALDPDGRLNAIPGMVPPLYALPGGCKFAPRCQSRTERCDSEEPKLFGLANGHSVRCWLFADGGDRRV
ncbi:MAG: ABC transporter ATP-binding protein [Synergistaceae bacterium]|nr:ABC transporter ATP-binding protein [Synergistaceae bacterium]